jgi:hypothetical protein
MSKIIQRNSFVSLKIYPLKDRIISNKMFAKAKIFFENKEEILCHFAKIVVLELKNSIKE